MSASSVIRRSLATIATGAKAVRQRPVEYTPEGAVSISYQTLKSEPLSLTSSIETAFGSQPDSLGIIVVRDLPAQYPAARERLLKLAYSFASLDESTRERFADPKSRYSFGWSHGKEIMNGKPDTLKGSYYANPVLDEPNVPKELRDAYPEYYGKNIWPEGVKEVESFESSFKTLGRLVFNIGCDLAVACQPFASAYLTDSSLSLADLIRNSQTAKARLLHYFPPSPDAPLPADDEPIDSWCGFHLDHSLLTGLCSAMYLEAPQDRAAPPTVVPSPSPSSGLYIRTRGGALTKVAIPVDCLAFQTGEALELATAGALRATPHCVRVGSGGDPAHAARVSRETLALFMQPNVDQQLSSAENFGQFSKRIFDEHYGSEGATM
ncbi:clavaminate synthase-like protein [Phanerochaete sordida]|uniref:Clavaminate synthase-like protein n=1 Tax=Phanerochaete sordida TaxID=48140 RepID=A0A9P3G533_9APHY|nr:clavaminate synthase-like protein [Phanerochaete sordida]